MGENREAPKKKGGCLGRLAMLVVLVVLAGLGAAVYFIAIPQDLSDLEGRGRTATGTPKDLSEAMANALKDGYELPVTEEEINLFLGRTLKSEQGGLLADHVSIRDVAVRLEDGRAEVIIIRDISGYPFTLSLYLRVEQFEQPDGRVSTRIYRDGGQYHESLPHPMVGGRFGRLPVPAGFLYLALPSFVELAAVYRLTDEQRKAGEPAKALDQIDEMARIRIEEGRLVLQPVGAAGMAPPPGGLR